MSTRNPKSIALHHLRRRQAVTLVLVLLLLALLSSFMARQSLQMATMRIASSSRSFQLQASWLAEGIALQWLEQAQDPAVDRQELLQERSWNLDHLRAQVKPSSSQNKLTLQKVKPSIWLPFWRRQNSQVVLADDPQLSLVNGGYAALECILSSRHLTGQDAYLAPEQSEGSVAPSDLLTVWGEGKVDLNHASKEIISVALAHWTEAQVQGILRLRSQGPLNSYAVLAKELSSSNEQLKTLEEVGCFGIRQMELLIRINKGKMSAVYFAVLDLEQGKVLEVRAIP